MTGVSGTEERSFASMAVLVSHDWRVRCNRYEDSTPILGIDAGHLFLSVSIARRADAARAVEFARELAREAAVFAAEVERLHDAQAEAAGGEAA